MTATGWGGAAERGQAAQAEPRRELAASRRAGPAPARAVSPWCHLDRREAGRGRRHTADTFIFDWLSSSTVPERRDVLLRPLLEKTQRDGILRVSHDFPCGGHRSASFLTRASEKVFSGRTVALVSAMLRCVLGPLCALRQPRAPLAHPLPGRRRAADGPPHPVHSGRVTSLIPAPPLYSVAECLLPALLVGGIGEQRAAATPRRGISIDGAGRAGALCAI